MLNKIENRLESWSDHHRFVTVDGQYKKYHKEFSGILYQSAVGSSTFFAKRSGLGSKPCFGGVKPPKTRSNFLGGFVICIENTFWKKWSKTTIPALSNLFFYSSITAMYPFFRDTLHFHREEWLPTIFYLPHTQAINGLLFLTTLLVTSRWYYSN